MKRRGKRNDAGAAQLAVAGLFGAGAAYAIGRGLLAERRAKVIDKQVMHALARYRLSLDTYLSPPVRGVQMAPRLRELADAHALSTEYDARKRQVLAQAVEGAIYVVGDGRGGKHLALPGGPPMTLEFSRRHGTTFRKRNDAGATRRAENAPSPLWAFAQYDDVLSGSWGVAIHPAPPAPPPTYESRRSGLKSFGRSRWVRYEVPVLPPRASAELYRWDGEAWQHAGKAAWNQARGRLDAASAPETALDGLNAAILASPIVTEALRAYLKTVIPTSFRGKVAELPTLAGGADVAFRSVARARCAADDAAKRRPGTKAATDAGVRREHAVSVARVALSEVCGRGGRPIARGGPCDVTLDALAAVSPDAPCSIEAAPCPHVVTRATLSEWRAGGMPAIGPYETNRPHTMGADPCCYYHPLTQARRVLRRKVEQTVPANGSPAWLDAVTRAEEASPHHGAWAECDHVMRRHVAGFGATGAGVGGADTIQLLRAFYVAVQSGETDAARGTYQRLNATTGGLGVDFDELSALDAVFFDIAHGQAHESGNKGYILWVHGAMKKRGMTIHHKKR